MSKLFYDHLTNLELLDSHIRLVVDEKEQQKELWELIDSILHHSVLEFILDSLQPYHHDEFIVMYHDCPHDHRILVYLEEKIDSKFSKKLENHIKKLEQTLLSETIENHG